MRTSRLLRGLVATALLGLSVGAPAAPAYADADECAVTDRAEGSYELFALQPAYVPPPLRQFTYDCASHLADRNLQTEYVLIFANDSFATFVAMIRSFENAGWITGPSVTYIDGDGTASGESVDADGLSGVTDPQWATARFSNAATTRDIVAITYTDGTNQINDFDLTRPSIYVDVFVSEAYGATGFGDASVLSNLRSVFDTELTPVSVTVLAGGAVMLMLVVGYPGALLSKVIGDRYEQLFGWTRKRLPSGLRAALKKKQPRVLVWLGFVVAAVVAGFVDPAFGINELSLRVLITGFASFALFNLVGWAVVRRVVVRLEPEAKPYIEFRWGSLLIVIGAVLVARLLEFSPGIIFGLVAGLTYAITLVASKKAIVVLVGSGFALALGLVGWLCYSLLSLINDPNVVLLTLTEFASGVTIEGISSLPLALLPFAIFDGGALLGYKKWVWGAAYAVGIAAFMLVLVTIPASFGVIPGDFVRWLLLFGAYALLALGVFAVDAAARSRKKRAVAAE